MSNRDMDAQRDPVRLRFIEAMERRAAGYGGDVRQLLDERIAVLRAEADHAAARIGVADGGGDAAPRTDLPRSPLGELVARPTVRALSRSGEASADARAASDVPAATTAVESLAYFRSTWSRLSAERRLKRSLATVPDNAGPLNSHQLVHRALQTMRETSPGYLHHFMTYVDALLWVDQASGGAAAGGAVPVRAKPVKNAKPPVRSRPG